MLREKIKVDLIESMKKGEKLRTSTIRLLLAAIKDKDIATRANADSDSGIDDKGVLELIYKMLKQREETAETYFKAGRNDLADKEIEESHVLIKYLPKQLSQNELNIVIKETIKELNASSLRDMGKVMQSLKESHAGKCDFQKASLIVRKELTKEK